MQFLSTDDIPIEYFSEKRTIIGRVERVIDGDTLRMSHCPTYFSCPERDKNGATREMTIKVRAYGIDSPELQKNDSDPPSQPYAEEAKQFTSLLTLDKIVGVKLLKKDKYGRVVGKIEVGSQDLSVELTRRGLATLYTGKGAAYDGNKVLLEAAQDIAQKQNLGIWRLGSDFISPSDFKRQRIFEN